MLGTKTLRLGQNWLQVASASGVLPGSNPGASMQVKLNEIRLSRKSPVSCSDGSVPEVWKNSVSEPGKLNPV